MYLSADYLVPGMKVSPDLRIDIAQSNTPVVMRAQFTATAEFVSEAVIPSGWWLEDAETDYYRSETHNDPSLTTLTLVYEYLKSELSSMFYTGVAEALFMDDTWAGYSDVTTGDWYYYVGDASTNYTYVMEQTSEGVGIHTTGTHAIAGNDAYYLPTTAGRVEEAGLNTVLATIDATTARRIAFIDFTTQYFRLPTTITNEYAGATITLTFTVQAVQDFMLNVAGDATVLPTVENAARIMTEAFYVGE
jgi:hypothetical protein